jgi:tetratricopeptide (TPR) repeat protein
VRGLLALAIAALALAGAAPAAPGGHETALRDLGDQQDAEARRHGASRLGEIGTMADTPRLVDALRDPDPEVRAVAERALLEIWHRPGDPETDRLFRAGLEQMQRGDAEAAVETFSRVIARAPDFAEGWNKRATVHYFRGDYARSLADCDEVMKRNPWHFGALSGYGMIYLQLGEPDRALAWFERALAVNPNLTSIEEALHSLRQLLLERRRRAT